MTSTLGPIAGIHDMNGRSPINQTRNVLGSEYACADRRRPAPRIQYSHGQNAYTRTSSGDAGEVVCYCPYDAGNMATMQLLVARVGIVVDEIIAVGVIYEAVPVIVDAVSPYLLRVRPYRGAKFGMKPSHPAVDDRYHDLFAR